MSETLSQLEARAVEVDGAVRSIERRHEQQRSELMVQRFHADHFLGVPGMLKSFSLRGRELPLAVYGGSPGLRVLCRGLRPVIGRIPYELRLVELEPGGPLARDGYAVTPFDV